MAGIFDATIPAETESLKKGASRERALRADLNTLLGTLFNDDKTPKDSTVTTAEIVDLAVTTGKLAALAVTAAKIAAGAVETAKLADAALHAWTDQTVGPLVAGQVYRIRTHLGSDSFTSSGAASNAVDTIFTANSTPPVWADGSTLSKLDPAGLLKMQDKFIQTAKLEDLSVTTAKLAADAVTTVKIADGAVTAAKLAAVPNGYFALARWAYSGTRAPVLSSSIVSNVLSTTTNHGISQSPATVNDVVAAILTSHSGGWSGESSGHGFNWGDRYFIKATSATGFTLHPTAQDAFDGTNTIALSGSITETSPALRFILAASVYKRNCDVVPTPSNDSNGYVNYDGARVIWRTTPTNAGVCSLTDELSAGSNDDASYLDQILRSHSTVEAVVAAQNGSALSLASMQNKRDVGNLTLFV